MKQPADAEAAAGWDFEVLSHINTKAAPSTLFDHAVNAVGAGRTRRRPSSHGSLPAACWAWRQVDGW